VWEAAKQRARGVVGPRGPGATGGPAAALHLPACQCRRPARAPDEPPTVGPARRAGAALSPLGKRSPAAAAVRRTRRGRALPQRRRLVSSG
jgi:hypothetical protein